MFLDNEVSLDANENEDDEMNVASPTASLTFNSGVGTSPNGEIKADNDINLPTEREGI